MNLATASATSSAPARAYFERWTDHDTWADWSPDTSWVRVDGPARVGTTGSLKPKGGPRLRFTISECAPADSGRRAVYTDTTRMPGARIVFRHTAEETAEGTQLGVEVAVTGPLAGLWARVLGSGFRTSAPADLARLVALVEARP